MSVSHANVGTAVLQTALKKREGAIFFLGIGGAGMAPLAELTASLGYAVLGADREENAQTAHLRAVGISVFVPHRAENLPSDAALLVYSLAVAEDTPEYLTAKSCGIPTASRAEFFGALLPRFGTTVGVSGSHGKSGTVGLLSEIGRTGGLYPTVLAGAPLPHGSHFLAGDTRFLFYEACEYKDSFLRFSPAVSLFLNLEWDHPDYFPNLDAVKTSFLRAADLAGTVVLNGDDENLSWVKARTKTPVLTFGEGIGCDFRITDVKNEHGYYSFRLVYAGGEVRLSPSVPGAHAVPNTAGAAAVALALGVSPENVACAVQTFRGIARRLERFSVGARVCYLDYAHHPTEIAETVKTVRELTGGRVAVLFSPHTFTRTQALFSSFAAALSTADAVYLTPIYPAREKPIAGVSAEALAKSVGNGAKVVKTEDFKSIFDAERATFVFMGAGDVLPYIRAVQK